jgi:hypothetical protein
VKGQSTVEIRSVESEEDAGQKSQKVKFMCCKIVKRLTVILPGEYSNELSVRFRTHKLFVALPGNTRQHYSGFTVSIFQFAMNYNSSRTTADYSAEVVCSPQEPEELRWRTRKLLVGSRVPDR